MPEVVNSSSKASAGEAGKPEKLTTGNSVAHPLPADVKSRVLSDSGNVSHLANAIFKLGEKGSGSRRLREVQDFDVLRKRCLTKGILFEDPEFPAQHSSIYGTKKVEKDITWVRPPGIVARPELFVSGPSRFDVKQGSFGDCWLLAAIASLAMNPKLFSQVVPPDQSFQMDQYAGIFHFRFWRYGRWVDVVIDDRLPMVKGELLGLHSAQNNEFWSALLEKAYAKLNGSYEALDGGFSGDAMQDFTGGVVEFYNPGENPPDLFNILLKACEKNSLMGCSFEGGRKSKESEENTEDKEDIKDEEDSESAEDEEASESAEDEEDSESAEGEEVEEDEEGDEDEEVNEDVEDDGASETVENEEDNEVGEDLEDDEKNLQGLIEGHAYSITQVCYVSTKKENQEKIPLVRVRNPWGTEDEWTGPWSDSSPEWESISDKEREKLHFKSTADGEFWMCFQDFEHYLSSYEICYLNPNSLTDNNLSTDKKEWEISAFEGEWVRGVTAGGCSNDLAKFQYNPQYCITLKEKSTVVVALMQKNRRSQGRTGVAFLSIGFSIYCLKEDSSKKLPKPLDIDFFEDSDNEELDIDSLKKKSAPKSQQYSDHRQVSCHLELSPGAYCIIPSAYEPDEEGEFLLRVFSEKPHNMEEYAEKIGIDEIDVSAPDERREAKELDYFKLLSGDDWELDWIEYKKILDFKMADALHNEGFSKDICRSMIAMLDTDESGKVGFHEYRTFWKEIKNLEDGFNEITQETDNDVGYLSTFDLRKALNKAGYHVNNHMLCKLVRRYGTEDQKITFEDFIMCAVRLRTMISIFKEHNQGQKNTATFTMEEWFDTTLYL